MPVQMLCPNLRCRKLLAVPDRVRGKLVKCQYCQTTIRVPAGSDSDSDAKPNPPTRASAGAD